MTTLGALRTRLRNHLDEPSTRQWTDAELNQWIYDAACDIARRTECLEDTATQAVNSATVTAPVDSIRIHRIEYTNGAFVIPLQYRDYHSMDVAWWSSQSRAGDPMFFTMWGFPPSLTIRVFPVPSAGDLNIFYYRLPTLPANDNAQVEIPAGWEDLAIYFAEHVALRKDKDPAWQEAYNYYESRLAALISISPRWTDMNDSVQARNMPPADLASQGAVFPPPGAGSPSSQAPVQ